MDSDRARWCWETAYQSNGAPVCVFTVQRDNVTGPTSGVDDRIYYYYARWTGSSWQKRFIAKQVARSMPPRTITPGASVDPVGSERGLYFSNAQNPFNLAGDERVTLSASPAL